MKRQTQISLQWAFSVGLLVISVLIPMLVEFYGHSSFSHLFWASVYYLLHQHCITNGSLTIIDNSRLTSRPFVYKFGTPNTEPSATIYISSPYMFQTVLLKGDIGLGESYVHREWNSDDLEAYLRLLMVNWHNFQDYLSIIDWLSIPMWKEFARLHGYQHTVDQDKVSSID